MAILYDSLEELMGFVYQKGEFTEYDNLGSTKLLCISHIRSTSPSNAAVKKNIIDELCRMPDCKYKHGEIRGNVHVLMCEFYVITLFTYSCCSEKVRKFTSAVENGKKR